MKKRWSSLLLCAAMLFSLCAPAAAVEGDVSYLYCDESGKNWKTGTCSTYKAVTEETDEWKDNWYVAQGTVNIGSCVHVSGNVHLILKDSCELNATSVIFLHEGASLTIYAQSDGEKMGKLTARYSGSTSAGIEVDSGSTITINGGEVTASGDNGAGIGGADRSNGGTIIINGGTVNARSNNGAGIGGGKDMSGGTVTINGGTVTATSSKGGAGIGGGDGGDGGTIEINGGKVTANGGIVGGAGIGGGGIGGGAGGNITINGGTVKATGGIGAGIGGGSGYYNGVSVGGDGGTIIINGGVVEASSGDGAGIGGGKGGASGTFSTGTNGNAFIVASSIEDNSPEKKAQWRGVIFEGTEGPVYGSPTLATDATISPGMTLGIGDGQTLIIGEGVTLTNNGTITGAGTIINHGTIKGNPIMSGVVMHSGKTEWSSDASGHWHECAVEGCTESHQFGYAAHTFGEWVTDTEATADTAGSKSRTCNICQYTETQTIPATGGGSSGGSTGGSGGGSYTPPTYKPEVEKPGEGGGTPSISPSRPERGDTVTVTPKPDEGYEVDEIIVTDKNGKPVEVTRKPDGTYTFTQPAGKVTIEVTYKAAEPAETPWSNPFADVPEGAWYYEAVRFVCERGLMNGCADGSFAPEDTLSRAQLAQILFNKEGQPAGSGQANFTDVSGGAWYSAAVAWAAENGIVNGSGGAFAPNAPITREQLAVMLWRYAGSPAPAGTLDGYADASAVSPYAREAMAWAVEQGIVSGVGGGQLSPLGQATRAQTAQMVKNFIERSEKSSQP